MLDILIMILIMYLMFSCFMLEIDFKYIEAVLLLTHSLLAPNSSVFKELIAICTTVYHQDFAKILKRPRYLPHNKTRIRLLVPKSCTEKINISACAA